jgi:hypothetical protein
VVVFSSTALGEKMTPRSLKLWAVLLCCLWGLTQPSAHGADVANKKALLGKARAASYSLKDRGLMGFQTTVNPNWRLVLKDMLATNPDQAETALKLLNGIHFTVSMDPEGAVTVTHHTDVEAPNPEAAKGFTEIYAGMEQAMTGFFDTWKPFMFTRAFPEVENAYALERTRTGYLLTYKEGETTDVATTLSKTLVITEMKVTTPAFVSVLKPTFVRSPQGLLLTGYDATYDGATDGDHVVLHVKIENLKASGQQLPDKLVLIGSSQDKPFDIELSFSDYTVQNRPAPAKVLSKAKAKTKT